MIETLLCLALNIYFEARDQEPIGQIAVAQVVLNRVESEDYPDEPCAVVKEGPTYSWAPEFPVRHRCQYSWYCDGLSDDPKNRQAWGLALINAVVAKYTPDVTGGATHYHAFYVSPSWADQLELTAEIGDHRFYRKDPEAIGLVLEYPAEPSPPQYLTIQE